MKKVFFISSIIVFIFITSQVHSQIETEQFEDEIENGNYTTAIDMIIQKLEVDSQNVALWYEAGKLYQLMQEYNQSIKALEKACTLDPANIKFRLALAKANKLAGKLNTSISVYEEILKTEPQNIAALSNLASLYISFNRNSDAFNLYKQLYFLDTLNVEYLRRMAKCKIALGEGFEGFNILQKAYVIDNSNLQVIYDLTKIYIQTNQNDTAIAILYKALEEFSNQALLYLRLGDAHFGKNHHYRSIPNYRKAIEFGYNSENLKRQLAISLFSIKEYKEACELFEQSILKDTLDYKVCMYLGNIYNELKQPDKALLFFDKTVEIITPSSLVLSSIYNGMSVSYHHKGQYYKQIEMIELRQKVLPIDYQSNQYWLEIAIIYENDIKDKQKALKYYNDYWKDIKDKNWYSEESKERLQAKINRIREDLHFEE